MLFALLAGAGGYLIWRRTEDLKKVPRRGASYATLLRRTRYRGSRKARSASRRVRSGLRRLTDTRRDSAPHSG